MAPGATYLSEVIVKLTPKVSVVSFPSFCARVMLMVTMSLTWPAGKTDEFDTAVKSAAAIQST